MSSSTLNLDNVDSVEEPSWLNVGTLIGVEMSCGDSVSSRIDSIEMEWTSVVN